jgi:cytochrome c oxidase subunit 3
VFNKAVYTELIRVKHTHIMSGSQKHPFHLVDPSPWPLLGSIGALASTIGGVMYMHSFTLGGTLLTLGLTTLIYTMFVWWRDVIRESTYEGHHTTVVQLGLRYGMILFIVSEVMFFLAFFWAFF